MSFKVESKMKRHVVTIRVSETELHKLRNIADTSSIGLGTLIMQMVRHCLFEIELSKKHKEGE